MRALFLIFCTYYLSTLSFAQVDTEAIKLAYKQEHYEKLTQRFAKADTSLKPEDILYLYHNFVFSAHFDTDALIQVENRIRDLNSSASHAEAIDLADSLLNVYPVSLVALFEHAYACGVLKQNPEELLSNRRYRALLLSITKDFDGRSQQTAFQIISPNDEFDIMRFFNLTATRYVTLDLDGKVYDVLTLKKNKLKMPEIWFDITPAAKQKAQKELERLREEREGK